MRSFLERGIPFDDVVAFNDVIALGAIARGAARSAARTRAAGPAKPEPLTLIEPDSAVLPLVHMSCAR